MLSILIFAHVPPPHHGQSFMIAQVLEELRSRPREVKVFHVDNRVSDRFEEVGRAGVGKVFRTLGYCLQAIQMRWRNGPMIFYYVPAPAKRGALYRDWLVMALCRPFFRGRLVFHWQAAGLGEWLAKHTGSLTALVTRQLLGGAALSLVLAEAMISDAAELHPKKLRILPNAIPDPCPDFDTAVLPARIAKAKKRRGVFRVLFLANCIREKGLYDAATGVFSAQRQLNRENSPLRLTLTVAGQFPNSREEATFLENISRRNKEWDAGGSPPIMEYIGFVADARKDRLFRESDCVCFPTYYPGEVMPITLIEALAYGLPIVTTRWRAIPEMLPSVGCWLVEAQQAEQVGAALREALNTEAFQSLREHFLANYRHDIFGRRLCATLAECFADAD